MIESEGIYMTEKENLIFEMENLVGMLESYLQVLENGEINETAYQRLDESMFSVLWALRYYFGENPMDSARITILEPDIQGMKLE